MKITAAFQTKVANAIAQERKERTEITSDARHARMLNINPGVYSEICKGRYDKKLSSAEWLRIGRRLNVSSRERIPWRTAKTSTFEYIFEQLSACQEMGISGIFCDMTDIGKTHTARYYVKQAKNAVYIDCSQVKTKQRLVRQIAQEFGLTSTGRYADVYQDLVYYLNFVDHPLVILDEAGDLKPDAFLELKALWNATERQCGWYMLGADGLRHKIEKGRDLFKIGYAEIIRRYGNKFQKVAPDGSDAKKGFHIGQFKAICEANSIDITAKLYAKCQNSLERLRIEYEKQQRANG